MNALHQRGTFFVVIQRFWANFWRKACFRAQKIGYFTTGLSALFLLFCCSSSWAATSHPSEQIAWWERQPQLERIQSINFSASLMVYQWQLPHRLALSYLAAFTKQFPNAYQFRVASYQIEMTARLARQHCLWSMVSENTLQASLTMSCAELSASNQRANTTFNAQLSPKFSDQFVLEWAWQDQHPHISHHYFFQYLSSPQPQQLLTELFGEPQSFQDLAPNVYEFTTEGRRGVLMNVETNHFYLLVLSQEES